MKKIFFVILTLLFFPRFSLAAPNVTDVSGVISSGETLTISGENMVSLNTEGWTSFFNVVSSSFEGSNPASDGYNSNEDSVISYDNNIKLVGNKSIKGIASGFHAYSNYGNEQSYSYDQGTINMDDLYMRIYSRWNYNQWPSENHKFFWLNGHFLNLIPNGGNAPERVGYTDGTSWYFGNIPGGAIKKDRWYCIELHKKRSPAPYTIEIWIDGVKVIDAVSSQGGPSPTSWGWENNTNYWGTTADFLGTLWQDGFVIGSQRIYPLLTVEIGTSPIYGQGNEKYQEPVYLSENSVQIKTDLTGLGNGPYYLWVTNNRQERSIAYALSNSGDTTSPASPVNLTVR